MKTLKNSGLIHDADYSKYPFGGIKNETNDQDGTPVVKEVYNDLLMNLYKIISDRNITFTEGEDNENNGYQLFNALKLMTNTLNDVQHNLTLSGAKWALNIDLTLLPDKYFLLCKSGDNYNDAVSNYTIKGNNGLAEYAFSSDGFSVGDLVLIVMDMNNGFVGYNLTNKTNTSKSFSCATSPVITYSNRLDFVCYLENDFLKTEEPKSMNLKTTLDTFFAKDCIIRNVFVFGEYAVVSIYIEDTNEFKIVKVLFTDTTYNDTTAIVEMLFTDLTVGSLKSSIFVYTDGLSLYFSNGLGEDYEDYKIKKCSFDLNTNTITFSSLVNLESSFLNSTNVFVNENGFLKLENGLLKLFRYNETVSAVVDGFYGQIFNIKSSLYYKEGNYYKNWNLTL